MQTLPTRHPLYCGFAALAVVAASMLASGCADSHAANQSNVSTAVVQTRATPGTSSTPQSPARTVVGTATTATTSASFRSVGAAMADASPSQR